MISLKKPKIGWHIIAEQKQPTPINISDIFLDSRVLSIKYPDAIGDSNTAIECIITNIKPTNCNFKFCLANLSIFLNNFRLFNYFSPLLLYILYLSIMLFSIIYFHFSHSGLYPLCIPFHGHPPIQIGNNQHSIHSS